jgi:hypothetical protein
MPPTETVKLEPVGASVTVLVPGTNVRVVLVRSGKPVLFTSVVKATVPVLSGRVYVLMAERFTGSKVPRNPVGVALQDIVPHASKAFLIL